MILQEDQLTTEVDETVNTMVQTSESVIVIKAGEYHPCSSDLRVFNAFVDETPRSMLCRPTSVKIALNLTGTSSVSYNPWTLLLATDTISTVMQYFKYIRADIKMKVLCRSSIYQYGIFTLTSLYGFGNLTAGKYPLTQRLSGPRTVIGDVNQRDAIEYHLPFIHQDNYLDVDNLNSDLPAQVWLDLIESNSINSAVTDTVDFMIFFNFENVSVAGVRNNPALPLATKKMEAQMFSEGVLPQTSTVAATTATVAGVLGYRQLVDQGFQLYQTFSKYQKGFSGLDEESNKKVDEEMLEEGKSFKVSPLGNLNLPSYVPNSQLLSSRYNTNSPSKSIVCADEQYNTISSIIQVPGFAGVATITGVGTVVSVPVRPRPEQSAVIQNTWVDYVSRYYRQWRGSMKFSFMFFTAPMITARCKISLAFDQTSIINDAEVGNVWSETFTIQGSVKKCYTVPYLRAYPWEDCVIQSLTAPEIPVFTVTLLDGPSAAGDSIPVIYMLIFVSAGEDFIFRGMRAPVADNWTGVLETIPEVKSVNKPLSFDKRMISQCDMQALFKGSDNFVMCNDGSSVFDYHPFADDDSLSSMLHRYSERTGNTGIYPLDGISNQIFQFSNPREYTRMSLFDSVSNWFRYWSGSIRFKVSSDAITPDITGIYMKNGATNTFDNTHAVHKIENGSMQVMGNLWNIYEFETKFYSQSHCAPVEITTAPFKLPYELTQSATIINPKTIYVSAGHDFQLYCLLPPPIKDVLPDMEWDPSSRTTA